MIVPDCQSPQSPASRPATRCRRPRAKTVCVAVSIFCSGLAIWGWTGGFVQICNALAERALRARDAKTATDWLAWSGQLKSDDPRAEFLRARLARREGRFDDVRAHLLRAWQLGCPAQALEREQWLVNAQVGQLRAAEPHLPALLTDQQGEGDQICEAFVTGYLMTYQINKARQLLDSWERDYPLDPLPHTIRARIHVDEHNWRAASDSLRAALTRQPNDPESVLALAEVQLACQQPREALQLFLQQKSGQVQQSQRARLGMAQCYKALGRSAEARQALTALVEEHPDAETALYDLAQLELEAGHYAPARKLLEQAREHDPKNPAVLLSLASVLRRAGETETADALLERANQIVAARGRIDQLVEKVALQTDDVAVRFDIGMLQLEFGSRSEGLLWLQSILQFQPDHEPARLAIAGSQGARSIRPWPK